MLEDGRLTDNKGRVIDFSNAMLVLTSNVGSRKILQMAGEQGDDAYPKMRAAVKAELGSAFRPEFLNRLDEVRALTGQNAHSRIGRNTGQSAPCWAPLGFRPTAPSGACLTIRSAMRHAPCRAPQVIVFESLKPSEVETVAGLMLKDLVERCDEEGFQVKWTPALTKLVVRGGFSSVYGARPLRRAVQRFCEDAVAEAVRARMALPPARPSAAVL